MYTIRRARNMAWLLGALAVVLVAAGYALALEASSAPQCCDAMAYQDEARSIVDGDPQLLWAHNYAYAAFLAMLQVVGLGDRLGVTLVQTTTLYATVVVAAIMVSRSTHASVSATMIPLAAVALVPASAWSGYHLSEGLAAPMLMIVFGLVVIVAFRMLRATLGMTPTTVALVLALGFASGLAWMVRPGLLWIPAATGLLVLGLSVYAGWRFDSRALLLPLGFVVAAGLTTIPQLSQGDVFKLELARFQSGMSDLYPRYATDLTGCGPPPLLFSPLTDSGMTPEAAGELAPDNLQWRLTVAVAHVVSGWDARPSPTYIDAYADRKWLFMSATSGFAIMAAISAAAVLWRRRRTLLRPRSVVLGALVLLFLASQLALVTTLTEFRFNLAGWLLAGFCLAVITGLRWWTWERAAVYIMAGLVVSSVVLVIGQMTLMYSAQWLECAGLLKLGT